MTNTAVTETEEGMRIESLLSNRDQFDAYVYTNWREALEVLEMRQSDDSIDSYLQEILPNGVPEVLRNNVSMVHFRQLVTPNYETHRFMTCVDVISQLKPVVFELTSDKFADVNPLKRALGKLPLHKKKNRNGDSIIEYQTVVDMSKCNGKSLSNIPTFCGMNLNVFHKQFFLARFPGMKDNVFDLSSWVESCNGGQSHWYKCFLSFFLKHAILFENFLTSDEDIKHTRDVFLPVFIELEKATGHKPLIVALEPTDVEGDSFWYSYPYEYQKYLPK